MWPAPLTLLLIAYLPGAVLYRLPLGQRARRAALPAEERAFWAIVLSIAVTSTVALALAGAGAYRLIHVLWINGGICVGVIAVLHRRLRFPAPAPAPGPGAAIPVALTGLVVLVTFHAPPAEYVMGGKDPGTYMNEGIQIAQHGGLIYHDATIASIPDEALDLFVRELPREAYYGSRFMGFFLRDADDGMVVGQFPHLYPVWIAIGYGIDGVPGARAVIGWLALLGVLAVYFAGAWLIGRPAAAAGAGLLAINVAQVWYGRYPNAEILTQGLVFGGLLGFSRANAETDRFFALAAAWLLSLACFTHLTGFIAAGALGGAALLTLFDRRAPRMTLLVPLVGGVALAAYYMATVLAPYIEDQGRFFRQRPFIVPSVLAVAGGYVLSLALARTRAAAVIRSALPWVVLTSLWMLAGYAYFLREPAGRLALHDAYALRHFTQYYLSPLGLLAALIGLTVVIGQAFWRGIGFVAVLGVFSVIFFYKIRVIPEHFWAARRFLAVVLPTACLLVGAIAFPTIARLPRRLEQAVPRVVRVGLGVVLVALIAVAYLRATLPIVDHVEYAGLVSHLDALDAQIADTDLVLVESRQASDLHTLALPLAYVYERDVLLLFRRAPPHDLFQDFLRWAKARYERILYLGSDATPLLSQWTAIERVGGDQFFVPEYESAYHGYPDEVRYKQFDALLFDLRPLIAPRTRFAVDIGSGDDAFVRGFFPKETLGSGDLTFRWTGEASFISVLGISPEQRTVTLWLNEGGRAAGLPPPRVEVLLEGEPLGTVVPTLRFEPYQFDIPPSLAAELAARPGAGRLEIRSTTWTPAEHGGHDERALGVMVDRVALQ